MSDEELDLKLDDTAQLMLGSVNAYLIACKMEGIEPTNACILLIIKANLIDMYRALESNHKDDIAKILKGGTN